MEFLIEMEALDPNGMVVTHRWSDSGVMTSPSDDPANTHYHPRIQEPGSLDRHLFAEGRTYGEVDGSAGEVRLDNTDRGLDFLDAHAVDGRAIRIYSMEDARAPLASRRLRLEGSVAWIDYPEGVAAIAMRDWLDALREPLQDKVYLGTTVDASSAVAEGTVDLKDKRKTLTYGRRRNMPLAVVDPFRHIYEAASNGFHEAITVRDRGVPLVRRGDHPTLAALRAASLQPSEYGTCAALGLVRLGGKPDGLITAHIVEGATLAKRTAGQIARRLLIQSGMVPGTDFLDADIAELDRQAPFECGIHFGVGADMTRLVALSLVLGSVHASCTPDHTGVYRIRRFTGPAAWSPICIDDSLAIDDDGDLERAAPADHADGLPVKEVIIRFDRYDAIANEADLDVNADAAFKVAAKEEWRQVKRTNQRTADRHLHAHTITIDTVLCHEADAIAECEAWLALYSQKRLLFRRTLETRHAAQIDIGTTVMLAADRFGEEPGQPTIVIGIRDRLGDERTTLIMWG